MLPAYLRHRATSPVPAPAKTAQLGAVSNRASQRRERLWGITEKCFGVWTAQKRRLVLVGTCFSYKSLSWLEFTSNWADLLWLATSNRKYETDL